MTHMTLGTLRRLLAGWTNHPDSVEVRIFLRHDEGYDETFGQLLATLDSVKEDETPAYIGIMIADTGDLK